MSASHKELGEGGLGIEVVVEDAAVAFSSESSVTAAALGSKGGVGASVAVVVSRHVAGIVVLDAFIEC
jgi:hypothetical protein